MKRLHILTAGLLVLAMLASCQHTAPPPANTLHPENTHASAPETEATQSVTLPTQPTDPTVSDATEATQPTGSTEATQPAPTDAPTEPPLQTLPAGYLGTLYTRDQLEAMPHNRIGYGPGLTSGGKRAPYAVSDQQAYGKYGANFIAPDNGCIYLTFDCGYEYFAKDENGNSYPVTGKILDVLKEKNVKAVFFITLTYAQKNPALVRRMIDEGHAVGNHSATHPDMSTISLDQTVSEIVDVHNYVLENYGYKMTLFRPPTGAFTVRSLATTQSIGYKTVHWSFAYADWDPKAQPEYDAAFQRITESAHSGAIYLLHAVSTTNAAILGDVIDSFRAQNYDLQLFQ